MFNFEKFPVYLKSEEIYKIIVFNVFSNRSIDQSLKNQLRRAASSISLNIAEGAAKYSSKDKKNYYLISRASVQECVAIIRLLHIERVITQELYNDLYQRFEEISKMLSGLIKHHLTANK